MNETTNKSDSFIMRLLPSRPFVLIALSYAVALFVFAILRLVFLLQFKEQVEGEQLSEILTAFAIGVRFDQIIILYCLLPVLLVTPWLSLSMRWFRRTVFGYLCFIFGFAFILLLSDVRFFATFGSHLNFLFYEYIDEGGIFWAMVFSDAGVATTFMIWTILIAFFGYILTMILRRTDRWPPRRSWISQTIWTLGFLALFALGIRGRTGLAPIDWGEAYFSENAFLNQLALNGLYTLARNYTERDSDLRLSTMTESERFPFMESSEAFDEVQRILRQPGEDWKGGPGSVRRVSGGASFSHETDLNVIIVLMESWAAKHTGVLGSPHDLTPHFDSAAERGILFTHFFASGMRTSFGLPAVLGSFPSLPGRSIMGRYDAAHPFRTISEILRERGYSNTFVYGGDLAFDNIQGFFTNKLYDRFVGEDDFESDQAFSKWGVPDHIVFQRAAALVDSLSRPFQMTVLTLSNHEPWDLPDSSGRKFKGDADSCKLFNAQLYADKALGSFLTVLKESGILDSTIVVLTADHARFDVSHLVLDPDIFRVPLLILGPSDRVMPGQKIKIAGSQTDILPTVLGRLGGQFEHASWGRDLLRLEENDPGFAMINLGNRIGCVTRDYFYLEWLGRQKSLYDFGSLQTDPVDVSSVHADLFHALQRRTRAYMQLAEQMSQAQMVPSPAESK